VPKALVFDTEATAEIAQQRCINSFRDQMADWCDADGNIVGVNAATDLPAVRAMRTVRWAVPRQRSDNGRWWIPAPPRFVLLDLKTQIQNAGGTLEEIADAWFSEVVI
jgi:hypothetical protein